MLYWVQNTHLLHHVLNPDKALLLGLSLTCLSQKKALVFHLKLENGNLSFLSCKETSL